MPGFDGTGPRGMGPMTGRGFGYCAVPLGPAWPVYSGRGFAGPYAAPWGIPYGEARPSAPATARKAEFDYLKGLAWSLREDLQGIETKIQEIEVGKE